MGAIAATTVSGEAQASGSTRTTWRTHAIPTQEGAMTRQAPRTVHPAQF